MNHLLFYTDGSYLLLFIRVVAGVILFPYGFQKLLGWYGGEGFAATVSRMSELGLPWYIGGLVIIGESFGSVALLAGLLGRIVAFFVFVIMAGAMVLHLKNGWMMNWGGRKKGEGVEYFVLFLSFLLIIMWKGSGAFSLDRWILQ